MGPGGVFITGRDFRMDGGVTAAYWYGEPARSVAGDGAGAVSETTDMTCYVRTLMGMAVAAAMTACTTTSRFAAEYKQPYCLAEDVNVYACSTFTGFYSVWFTGPQMVDTICSSSIPVPGVPVLKRGCPVRILKLFKTAAGDASYSDAKLEIIDTDTGTAHIVYVKWPGAQSLLSAGPAAHQK